MKLERATLNLDCMESDDLMEVWAKIHFHQVLEARNLFPNRPRGYVRATEMLGSYAANKATAQTCRLRGDIQAAEVYELICERIYGDLPPFAKW